MNCQQAYRWFRDGPLEILSIFFNATKLCDVSQIIFGPSHLWIEVRLASESCDGDFDEERVYQHHTSNEACFIL